MLVFGGINILCPIILFCFAPATSSPSTKSNGEVALFLTIIVPTVLCSHSDTSTRPILNPVVKSKISNFKGESFKIGTIVIFPHSCFLPNSNVI